MQGPAGQTGKRAARLSRFAGLWVAAFTLLAGSAIVPARATAFGNPISNFFSRNEQPLKEYRAFRRMHAAADKGSHEAWLDAWTELKDGRFSYEIVSERGSDAVHGKGLRPRRARARALVNSGDGAKADLTAANYESGETSRDTDGSQVVPLKPKRNDVL